MAVQAKAVKTIRNNGKIVGYTLKDATGNTMDVSSEAIIKAMKENKINISNLIIDGNDKLVIKDEVKNNIVKDESKKVEKQIEHKNSESKVEKDTNKHNKMEYMHKLVDKLNLANKVYEQGKDEIMSNHEYDRLYDELVELEKELGVTLANSPTINIGYEVVSEQPKEKHKSVMMSLAKTKSLGDIETFTSNQEVMVGWKLDGLTVVVTYNNGELVKAVTRGNGEVGELITNNYKHFVNIPHKIPYQKEITLRGEAIITYSDFNKINAKLSGDEQYKNPRNLASGSVRQLSSKVTASRNVRFVAFTLVNAQEIGIKTVEESYKFMERLGFEVVQSAKANRNTISSVMNKFSDYVESGKLDTPVDGLVITYNDIAYGKSLGNTAKSPRHSMAFKWKDECVNTQLIDIEWSASKTGLLNPVAIFEPVDIEGSTVSRASVHNVSIFLDLQLGYGDVLSVYKANMIIPQISENLTRTGTCMIPDTCPVCGGPTQIVEEENSGVYTLYCIDPECPAKGNRLLKHFVTRDAMNIDGISGATLEKFVEFGIVDSFASVYRIYQHPEIMSIEGFGEKSFYKMVNSINKARKVKLHNLIYALSIPNVGLETAKLICKHFNNDLKRTIMANYMELVSIPGVGETIATSFYNYFHNKENVEAFIDLVGELEVIQEEVKKADVDDPMNGKTFCVTGSVNIFPNRNAIKDLIESRGGKLTGSVSRSTDFLVTNDTTSGSRKNVAAQQYGIPILSEVDFINKFNITV